MYLACTRVTASELRSRIVAYTRGLFKSDQLVAKANVCMIVFARMLEQDRFQRAGPFRRTRGTAAARFISARHARAEVTLGSTRATCTR